MRLAGHGPREAWPVRLPFIEGRATRGGAESQIGYPSENVWRVPICDYQAPIVGVGSSSREDTSSTQPSIKMLDEPARGMAFAGRGAGAKETLTFVAYGEGRPDAEVHSSVPPGWPHGFLILHISR